MKKRTLITCLITSLVLFSLLANASAITGRLGNSRMTLRLDVGETAERYFFIENVNDVPITVEIFANEDVAEDLNINEKTFVLQPGESKKAYFSVKPKKAGTEEIKLGVAFTPDDGGAGIVLAATITVVASGENSDTNIQDDSVTDTGTSSDDESGFSFNPTGNAVQNTNPNQQGLSLITVLLIATTILVIIFIILLIYATKAKTKKRVGRPGE